ncbi:MAG: RNA 2',3'-cyclic phosphodiesterase, partial [Chlamydiae bacterium]|nr:RNA 2',3'-cyclic phosphodiesterase [Chlamydiota bacterium]
MDENSEMKSVFFAFEASSPWPQDLPEGRYLEENDRHMTIAFLGDIHYPTLEKILSSFPLPKIKVGLTGKFNRCHFLPRKRPNVVAWHVDLFDKEYDLDLYQKEVVDWLQNHDLSVRTHKKGFLPHVTICRRPFEYGEWRKAFHPLPVIIQNIHLYESLGHLKYKPLWTYQLKPPFEEIEHTADVAFHVRGENLQQI